MILRLNDLIVFIIYSHSINLFNDNYNKNIYNINNDTFKILNINNNKNLQHNNQLSVTDQSE